MLTVEEVDGKAAFRRFVELPFALYRDEPRWAPPVLSYEQARVDGRRNPRLAGVRPRYLLAWRGGRAVGRVLALDDGRFGCFDAGDEDAAGALLESLGGSGVGPMSFGDEQDGVVVAGFETAGVTGRQWHPLAYAASLEAAGLGRVEECPTWRIAATAGVATPEPGGDAPAAAGPYVDPRLVFRDIAAVPDVAPWLREGGTRALWSLARRARRRAWEACTIVRVDGDPAELVPALVSAAAAAGYRWAVSPWAPGEPAPEAVHAVFGSP